jgi:cellulose synthase/poly-beta-1,6-N-acetylglucosamine synthase-like glycosyltransferase
MGNMEVLFWVSFLCLYYIYDGYLRVLQLLSRFLQPRTGLHPNDDDTPYLTILIAVYNEENVIVDRITNILESEYPANRLEVLVASDGSTDATDELVESYGDPRVHLLRSGRRVGKTEVQNRAIEKAKGEILVFTDAGTRFDRLYLKNVAEPFTSPEIGGVDGNLFFVSDPESGISQSQGFYWGFELRLRRLESRLGILCVASGACFAVRRQLFRPMYPAYGEDCIVPLDIVSQNRKVVHASEALAYDRMDRDPPAEFRSRARMTVRNWQGTWSRPRLLNPFRHPGYALALWSHKLLRWLSPLFLIALTISSVWLAMRSWTFFQFLSAVLALFYLAGVAGWLAERRGVCIPVASTAFSFLLANLGFLAGLWSCLQRKKVVVYRQ